MPGGTNHSINHMIMEDVFPFGLPSSHKCADMQKGALASIRKVAAFCGTLGLGADSDGLAPHQYK